MNGRSENFLVKYGVAQVLIKVSRRGCVSRVGMRQLFNAPPASNPVLALHVILGLMATLSSLGDDTKLEATLTSPKLL